MKREEGFYWVMWEGYWKVAWWIEDFWYLPGFDDPWNDEDMQLIDETKIIR